MVGVPCGIVLGWHEEPALAMGKTKSTGVIHGQSQDLGICMWRVRLSQQDPHPRHGVRTPGETPRLGQCGEVYSQWASDVDQVFSLQHMRLWPLH